MYPSLRTNPIHAALISLMLLTTTAGAMNQKEGKEAVSKEVSEARQQHREKLAIEIAKKLVTAKKAAEAKARAEEEPKQQEITASTSDSSSSATSNVSAAATSANTTPTPYSNATVSGLSPDEEPTTGSLDADENNVHAEQNKDVTLTAADKTTTTVPITTFNVSQLYASTTAARMKGGRRELLADIFEKDNPIGIFPSAAALNAFVGALNTTHVMQQQAIESKTEYYPHATAHNITTYFAELDKTTQKINLDDRTFIFNLANYLQIPEIAIATAPECLICSEHLTYKDPHLSCGHTVCLDCLVKTFVQRGEFIVTETESVYELIYRPNNYYYLCPECRKPLDEDIIKKLTELASTIYPSQADLYSALAEKIATILEEHRTQPHHIDLLIDALAKVGNPIGTDNQREKAVILYGSLRPTTPANSHFTAPGNILEGILQKSNRKEYQGIRELYNTLPKEARPREDHDAAILDDYIANLYLPDFNQDDRTALQKLQRLRAEQKKAQIHVADLLWKAYSKHPYRDGIFARLPESDLKTVLIPKILDFVYQQLITKPQTPSQEHKQPQFDFLGWYLSLPEGHDKKAIRTQIHTALIAKAAAFLKPYFPTSEKDAEPATLKLRFNQLKIQFDQLPESLLKMLIRHGYWWLNSHTPRYPNKALLDALPIDVIMEKRINIYNNPNKLLDELPINVSGFNLTSLDGIDALIILHNEKAPIEYLDLSKNNLQSVNPNLLRALTHLISFSLQENHIQSLPNNFFSNCHQLRTIYLAKNNLTTVPAKLFSKCSSVRKIDISENKLTSIAPHAFDDCLVLGELYLNNNQLRELDPQLIQNCDHLGEINVSDNQLMAIPERFFTNHPQLDTIGLANNKLESLSLDVEQYLPRLETLTIDGNPWKKQPDDIIAILDARKKAAAEKPNFSDDED